MISLNFFSFSSYDHALFKNLQIILTDVYID